MTLNIVPEPNPPANDPVEYLRISKMSSAPKAGSSITMPPSSMSLKKSSSLRSKSAMKFLSETGESDGDGGSGCGIARALCLVKGGTYPLGPGCGLDVPGAWGGTYPLGPGLGLAPVERSRLLLSGTFL